MLMVSRYFRRTLFSAAKSETSAAAASARTTGHNPLEEFFEADRSQDEEKPVVYGTYHNFRCFWRSITHMNLCIWLRCQLSYLCWKKLALIWNLSRTANTTIWVWNSSYMLITMCQNIFIYNWREFRKNLSYGKMLFSHYDFNVITLNIARDFRINHGGQWENVPAASFNCFIAY